MMPLRWLMAVSRRRRWMGEKKRKRVSGEVDLKKSGASRINAERDKLVTCVGLAASLNFGPATETLLTFALRGWFFSRRQAWMMFRWERC